jgi:hypothetical protein
VGDKTPERVDERGGVRVDVRVDAEDDLALDTWHGEQGAAPSDDGGGRAAIGRDGGQDTQGAGQGSYQVTFARPVGALFAAAALARQINAKTPDAGFSRKQESEQGRQRRGP